MKLIFSIVAILGIAMTIQLTYAELDQNEVPFDFDFKSCTRSTLVTEAGEFDAWYCTYLGGIPTGVSIEETVPLEGRSTIEITVDEPEQELIAVEKPKPKTTAEIKLEELQRKLAKEGELVSHEHQLLQALLSLKEECELGTEQGAPIQHYESFTITTFEPYTHTDLGTQYILKQIEVAIQKCKAQQVLKFKVLGDQYLHIPGKDDVKQIWMTNATLPEDAQAKYDEAKMFDYFSQKSKNDAENFKCTREGRARGLGYDCKAEEDQVIPETIFSQAGMDVLSKYNAYQATGETDLPKRVPDAEFDPTISLDQYIKAYGISEEELKEWYESRNP